MTASQLKVHYFEARIDCLHLPLSRSRSQANVAPKVVDPGRREEGRGGIRQDDIDSHVEA